MIDHAPIEIPGHGLFQPFDARGAHAARDTARLITEKGEIAFGRDPDPGHVTGSGFVVSPDRRQTLLMHHRKLDKWLMPGGHCDGEPNACAVAAREIMEETGLTTHVLAQDGIFDIDVHEIPARGTVPTHLHFDIRYLFEADPTLPVPGNNESLALAWVDMSDLERYTREPAILVVRHAGAGHR